MSFTVYKVTHQVSDNNKKLYIGLTQRTLDERLAAHFNESTRRKARGISEFSLGFAIRDHLNKNDKTTLGEYFSIEALATFSSLEEMRKGEAYWIERFGAMAPKGYNLMRGGSSVGGPSNAKPCNVFIGSEEKIFESFSAAARFIASEEMSLSGVEVERFIGTARSRVKSGWSLTEALELEPRIDERTTKLSRKAREEGVKVDTARSREQRKKVRIARDANNVQIKEITHPTTGQTISWTEFFRLCGVNKSTGRFRLGQIAASVHSMSAEEIRAHISKFQDRKKKITIKLPDETTKTLGVNEWAHLCECDGLGFSAIKSRLKKAGPEASNEELLVAIGARSAPSKLQSIVQAPAQSRKKHCSDWSIQNAGKKLVFANQASFVDACIKAIKDSKVNQHLLGKQPDDEYKVKRSLQAKVSTATKNKKSPTEIAKSFGILDSLLHD